MGKIRLYVPQSLANGGQIALDEAQSHYLSHVMKLKLGDVLSCFDNQSGEYECVLFSIGKKNSIIDVKAKNKDYEVSPDIWLLFAPLKKDKTDFVIEKATELGVRKIVPVITRYTITEKVKIERLTAQTIEASEQCRRTDIPTIEKVAKFSDLWQNWDHKRKLYYLDETLQGSPVKQAFSSAPAPCAVLVGPEGGFATEELAILRRLPFAQGVKLGNRILRAETAAAAALSCWQAMNGDWQ